MIATVRQDIKRPTASCGWMDFMNPVLTSIC